MRPLCIATIGAILGIIMGLYLNSIVLFVLAIFIFLILFLVAKVASRSYQKLRVTSNWYRKAIIIFFICLFSFWGYTYLLEKNNEQINQIYNDQEVEVQAVVVSDKVKKEYKDVYQIQIEKVEKVEQIEQIKQAKKVEQIQSKTQKLKILLNLKRDKKAPIELKYGDKISFTAIYETPSGARNTGGFDYRQYSKTKGIAGIMTVKSSEIQVLEKNHISIINRIVHYIKYEAISRIRKILPEDTANLCTGLLLGEKSELSEDIQEDFRKSSLSHMLAISGAHVSYILLGVTTVIQKLGLHKRWSKIFLIFFLIFFMFLVRIYTFCYKSLHYGNFAIISRSFIPEIRHLSKFSNE